jgi:hypothetical protein
VQRFVTASSQDYFAESAVLTTAAAAPTTVGDQSSSQYPECRVGDQAEVLGLGLI